MSSSSQFFVEQIREKQKIFSEEEFNYFSKLGWTKKDLIIFSVKQFKAIAEFIRSIKKNPSITIYPKNGFLLFKNELQWMQIKSIVMSPDFSYSKLHVGKEFLNKWIKFSDILNMSFNYKYVMLCANNGEFVSIENSNETIISMRTFLAGGRIYCEQFGETPSFNFVGTKQNEQDQKEIRRESHLLKNKTVKPILDLFDGTISKENFGIHLLDEKEGICTYLTLD